MSRIIRFMRICLTSRYLFNNWPSAGAKYFLVRCGFINTDYIDVKCHEGSRDKLPVKLYRLIISGHYDRLIKGYSCIGHAAFYLNGSRIPIEEFNKSEGIDLAIRNG